MHTLLFLDPGHFHAALTLRVPQARAADEVFVYAREGAELRDFLALAERFNRRSPHPTRWRPVVTTSMTRSGGSPTAIAPARGYSHLMALHRFEKSSVQTRAPA
jgi:hypothetical protein